MRVQISKDVDSATLATQLSTALGIQVAVSTRNPGQDDGRGGTLPGVVVLLDANTGNELPDQDAAKVAAVLAGHVPPDPVQTPAKALADALGSATTILDVKGALKAYADNLVAREVQARQRSPRGRG